MGLEKTLVPRKMCPCLLAIMLSDWLWFAVHGGVVVLPVTLLLFSGLFAIGRLGVLLISSIGCLGH